MPVRNPKTFVCKWCSKSFLSLWKKKYCSKECYAMDISHIWRKKELVIRLYVNEKKSCIEIGKIICASEEQIRRKLHRWGIEVRKQSETSFGRKQTQEEIIKRINTRRKGKGFVVSPIIIEFLKSKKGKSYEELYGEKKAKEMKERISGKNSLFYLNGNGKSHYPSEFSSSLKNRIRKRDNYTCQECGKLQKELLRALDIHHIDFNKKNNDEKNLITLCRQCHNKTLLLYNPKYWINYYQNKMLEVIKIAC